MDDIVERLRNATEDEREWVEQQDVWHEELLDEAADEITALRARVKELEAENKRAWTERNHAYAKVKGWEAVVYVEGLPLREVEVDEWGAGEGDAVTVPEITPKKLTELLDEIAVLRALKGDKQS